MGKLNLKTIGASSGGLPCSEKVNGKQVMFKSYQCWINMLQRCYGDNYQKVQPTYLGCSVCDDWLQYPNFKSFYDRHFREGFQLDKDILVEDNKLYSPHTCIFVPLEINNILTHIHLDRGSCPVGVSKRDRAKPYQAQISLKGKRVHLGSFKTMAEAYTSYKTTKECHIKDLSEEYYNKGEITLDTHEALMRYKVTDKLG